MIQDIQIQQLDNGFKFQLNGEHVEVTRLDYNKSTPMESEVSMCRVDNFHVVGPYTVGFILKYLKETDQLHLIDLETIMIGQRIAEDFGFKKIDWISSYKGMYRTHKGPMTLVEIGKIGINAIEKKSHPEWFKKLKEQQHG